ncbi:hypothetical protein A0U87_24520 [Sphingobium sp. MP9-4]|uniref:hypothetical protein n=1 Tax=Sphingobium sp. MP9-4 TaxID=1761936 RepID=UPI0010CA9488|nr:hypothetical protein [Sphingobium sp. MP9-4]TKV40353.1 hypothetical protein A0U87_24520 [Sphingobium sp. MP9-4]
MSTRENYHQKIKLPSRFDTDSIAKSIKENTEAIIYGGLKRRQYHEAAFSTGDLRELPPGHLFNHCVRGPASAFANQEAIEQKFTRMLDASNNPDALQNVAQALNLSPGRDAELLWKTGTIAPDFLRLCRKGYLGKAIKIIPAEGWGDCTRTELLSLVSNVAIYNAAFQVQLIGARAWMVDHLLTRLDGLTGPYRQPAAIRDIIKAADAVVKVDDHYFRPKKRQPNADLITDLRSLAESYLAISDRSEGEIEHEIRKLLPRLGASAKKIRSTMERLRNKNNNEGKVIKNANWGCHRAYYGHPAGFCIAFATKRLIQLSDQINDIVDGVYENNKLKLPSTFRDDLPNNKDDRVNQILFTYRYIYDIELDQSVSLADLKYETEARGNTLNQQLLKTVHTTLGKLSIRREKWAGRMALKEAQRFDVLIEYLFRSVPTAPPATSALAQAKQKREQDQKHRPPGRYRASGKGRKRHKK